MAEKDEPSEAREILVALSTAYALNRCDSWGDVTDRGEESKWGRFEVTVYFDTETEAANFRDAIKRNILEGPYAMDPDSPPTRRARP